MPARARRAGRAVSGLTNSTQMRALCDTRWSEAAGVRAELAGTYGRKLARRKGIGIPPTSESAVLEISVSLTEQGIPLHCRAGARDACQRPRRIGWHFHLPKQGRGTAAEGACWLHWKTTSRNSLQAIRCRAPREVTLGQKRSD